MRTWQERGERESLRTADPDVLTREAMTSELYSLVHLPQESPNLRRQNLMHHVGDVLVGR